MISHVVVPYIHVYIYVYICIYYHDFVEYAWKVENASPGACLRTSFRSGKTGEEGKKKKKEDKNPNPRARPLLHYHMIYVCPSPPPCLPPSGVWTLRIRVLNR